ncbi:MAG: MarR family transcriptional regulator [Desulfobacterales bacterium]|nr:MarR family transcriptional regulator [Deltaproteobacteria bacterium]NNL74775.1 MarR family transcriptional regulator [Desulfobacterales bacterium]
MFFLKDLPTDKTLREFAIHYPNMNPSALTTFAELVRTGSDLLTAVETILRKCGLSQGRLLTLIVMNRTPNEETNPSSLAEKVGVRRATMTGLLDGLEKDKLIERLVDSEDRRKKGVRLTIRGQQVLSNLLPDYYRYIAKVMAKLTEKERQELTSLLGKIKKELSSSI